MSLWSGLRVDAMREHARNLFGINPFRRRWPVALKAAITLLIPLSVATALGYQDDALLCSLGAFTVLYGPHTAGRFRARLLAVVGIGLILSATLGALFAYSQLLLMMVMVAVAVIASVLVVTLKVGPPGPVFFPLAIGVSGLAVSQGVDPKHIIISVSIGAVTAWIIGMSDVLIRPRGPEEDAVRAAASAIAHFEKAPDDNDKEFRKARLSASNALHSAWITVTDGAARNVSRGRLDLITSLNKLHHRYAMRTALSTHAHTETERTIPWSEGIGEINRQAARGRGRTIRIDLEGLRQSSLGRPTARYLLQDALTWPSEVLLIALRVGLATAVAAIVGMLLGGDRTYWAVFTALLVVHQGGTRKWQTYRGLQRFIGTVLGLAVFGIILALDPRGWWLVLILGGLQFSVEMLVVRNYALGSIFITPLALTTAYVGAGRMDSTGVIADRLIDTTVGVVVAIIMVWLVGRRTPLLNLRGQGRRCILAMEAVMADISSGVATSMDARERRRVLYFELLEYEGVGDRALSDDPASVQPYWDMHNAIIELGYFVLGAAWHPTLRHDTERFVRARRGFADILAAPVTVPRAASDIEAAVHAVHRIIADWDGLGDVMDEETEDDDRPHNSSDHDK